MAQRNIPDSCGKLHLKYVSVKTASPLLRVNKTRYSVVFFSAPKYNVGVGDVEDTADSERGLGPETGVTGICLHRSGFVQRTAMCKVVKL